MSIEQIQSIKEAYLEGELTYDEAKALAEPIIKRMNDQGRAIAQRHGVKYYPFGFSKLMR